MLQCIFKDMMTQLPFLQKGIVFGVLFFVASCIITFLRRDENKEQINYKIILSMSLLVIYFITLLQIVFLSREPFSRDGVLLQLGGTWTPDAQGKAYVIENILLFIPFGIVVPMNVAKVRKWWKVLLVGMCCSIIIEFMQRITGRGFFQIDDIVMNSIGSVVGYFFFWLVRVCMNTSNYMAS